jgi:hypothetical protein
MTRPAGADVGGLILRAEHVGELVYGTTAVLIAMAGLEIVGGVAPNAVGAIVLAGAIAMWLTHAYAGYLGRHAVHGKPSTVREVRAEVTHSLRESFPIVWAAVPATILLAGASIEIWSVSGAIRAANIVGIVILAAAGWTGARATGSSPIGATVWAIATASIGIGIVVLELLLHQ